MSVRWPALRRRLVALVHARSSYLRERGGYARALFATNHTFGDAELTLVQYIIEMMPSGRGSYGRSNFVHNVHLREEKSRLFEIMFKSNLREGKLRSYKLSLL